MSTTYTFQVDGMHCKACVLLTEGELADLPGVHSVKASLRNRTLQVTGDFADLTSDSVLAQCNAALAQHGYTLSIGNVANQVRWSEFVRALPLALLFVWTFIGLQKLGIVHLVSSSEVSYGTVFVIGLIASVSTCMAVVGGLVLSLSASYTKAGEKIRPLLLFHGGRLGAFFLLGGLIGLLGSVVQLGAAGTFVLTLFVAVILVILGINLLDIVPWMQHVQFSLPGVFGKWVRNLTTVSHTLTPLLVGIATFILPCGFTQSMQFYALSTGSFWTGAFTMLVFALGTLPLLALLSYGSLRIRGSLQTGVFYKTAGLVVIFFGIFNLINALVGFGIMRPIFSF